jgi:hypothetical protein
MAPKRRGRPKKVMPGQEWLLEPLPDYLLDGLSERLREQDQDIARMELARKALLKQYGGFGIADERAYRLNDVQDPEVPEDYRRKVLKEIGEARQMVQEGNLRGKEATRTTANADRDGALARHNEMIALRRSRGHSERTIARRLADLERVSLTTAQRWLRTK